MAIFNCFITLAVLLLTINAHPVSRGNRNGHNHPRSVTTTPAQAQLLATHDPLENIGVQLEDARLIEGDIRRARPSVQSYQHTLHSSHEESRGAIARMNTPAFAPSHQAFHGRRNLFPVLDQTWTDRVIPYVLDTGFNTTELTQIHQALTELMEGSGSCITFMPRQDQQDFIFITGKLRGCWSDIGRQGGNQTVSVSSASNCVTKGIVMHELMHSMGYWHEHNRSDRDTYINILFDNIIKEHHDDFNKNGEARLNNLTYDYYSIMHYSTTMFSIDSTQLKSIQVYDPNVTLSEVGQRKYLSEKDKQRIKSMYNCPLSKCSYPLTMNNGYVSVKNTTVGSIVKYSCTNSAYGLIGASERMCQYDGTWSGSPPLCMNRSVLYCNFEDPQLCGWSQDTTDEADWTRLSSHTASEYTGPIVDHTIQSSDGYYIYLEGTHVRTNATARLISPWFQEGRDMCILFWYNMYGAGMGTLNVYMNYDDGTRKKLWSLSGNQNVGWKIDLIPDLNSSIPFQIVFEAIRGPSDSTDMAIDDVIIGGCQNVSMYENAVIRELKTDVHKCDFDQNFCGWSQNGTDLVKWFRRSGPTTTIYTGPECDLRNCQNGSYVYIETSYSRKIGETAAIYSPIFEGTGQMCITFNYHMYGRDIGNLSIFVTNKNTSLPIWSASGDSGKFWLNAHADFIAQDVFQIVVEASSGNGIHGDIAFDDVLLTQGTCPAVITCDFDQNMLCDLYNDVKTDDFDWSLASRNTTLSSSTGPMSDHTNGQGYFVYIEASAPRVKGDTARLVTPFLHTNERSYCVSFWYYMYGKDVATLSVYTRDYSNNDRTIWTRQGELGPVWTKVTIDIPPNDVKFKIIFEGVVGQSYVSDIALDDIVITEDTCALYL